MRKILVLIMLAMVLGLFVGCAQDKNITQVQEKFDKWGEAVYRDVIQKGDTTTYYFYYAGRRGWWYCQEYVCDKDGNILKRRDFSLSDTDALKMWREEIKK